MDGRTHEGLAARLLTVCLLSPACARALPHPPYAPQTGAALVEVDRPPPPGRVETVPDRPTRSAVWVDGEWEWRRDRWRWVPGAWFEPPPGVSFSPWVFVRGPDGRLWYAPGAWRDPAGATVEAPAPKAVAVVDSGEVVNASGATEATGRSRRPAARPATRP